jgi:hypothetical protein
MKLQSWKHLGLFLCLAATTWAQSRVPTGMV